MTNEELDALVARGRGALEGVTKGPWDAKEKGKHPNPYVCGAPQEYEFGIDRPVIAYFTGMGIAENSRFVASARDLVPELLDALTALRAERDAVIRAAEAAALERAAQVAERTEIYQNHVTVSRIRALITPDARAALDAVIADARREVSLKVVLGMRGEAFDGPNDARAYTYRHQPGNVMASRIGEATAIAAQQDRCGDYIDRGLVMLRELQTRGLGVFTFHADMTALAARVEGEAK